MTGEMQHNAKPPSAPDFGEPMTWQAIAMGLWALLDDIDTASDVAKADDQLYRSMVHQIHMQRYRFADSDGHGLLFNVVGEPSG